MATPILASTDLVAAAFIRSLGITATGPVLPSDCAQWASTGFVAVTVVGGTPSLDFPLRKPSVQTDCWAVAINGGNKAPWGQATNLAETITNAVYSLVEVNLSSDQLKPAASVSVKPVRVLGAWLLSEPRRIYGDEGSYARVSFDLSLNWVQL